MEKDIIMSGIHIGEHSFESEKIIDELRVRCVEPGYNFVTIRTWREPVEQEYFIEWAKYLAENKVYFVFLYTIQSAPAGKETHLTKETVDKIKEVAGEYFLGDMIGETGSSYACKFPGYYTEANERSNDSKITFECHDSVKDAHDTYVESVSKLIEIDKKLGIPAIVSVEATGLNKYNAEAGVEIPMLELMCGHPEILVSSLRGVARAIDSKLWGTYIAHEWYGGMRHDDILKRKRLALAYRYAYLAGSNAFCLESGDECILSYGHTFDVDSDICQDYRDILGEISQLIKEDCRPKGGPKVKVAFVSGLHDSWGGWGGSSVWSQFEREEWGHNEAEHSWRMLEEVGTRRTWNDIANYGEYDLSANPAYGMYDVIPIEAGVDALSRYDYLIFLGWNSMTDENMDKLIEYVRGGGHLLMSAAHLNCSTRRDGEFIFPDENKLRELFGVRATGEVCRTNNGVKLKYESLDEKMLYPGSKSFICDPIYSHGYVNYEKFELCGGETLGFICDSFMNNPSDLPAVVENKLGDGVATLITSTNYPGHPALYMLYRAFVREFVTASARDCEIRVLASDRLRYAVYEGNKVYLLNTDYDMPIVARITFDGKTQDITLEPMELKAVQL